MANCNNIEREKEIARVLQGVLEAVAETVEILGLAASADKCQSISIIPQLTDLTSDNYPLEPFRGVFDEPNPTLYLEHRRWHLA